MAGGMVKELMFERCLDQAGHCLAHVWVVIWLRSAEGNSCG